jgi:hypothetical protein
MKKLIVASVVMVLFAMGCEDSESISEFTGNEATYELSPASAYAISGAITFKERTDGFTIVAIALNGTEGSGKHPVHLHLGSIATPDADVAAMLSPVEASTGKSETLLKQLANESAITYSAILDLEACVKIHLSDTGDGRNVVLAGGNIGASFTKNVANGRQMGFASCKSE